MVDRTEHPPQGLLGGDAGSPGQFQLNGQTAPPKTIMWLQPGDEISMNPPGGGGYGDPWQRDPHAVLRDVIYGYVSLQSARDRYGVIIHVSAPPDALVYLPDCYELDWPATEALRQSKPE